MKHDIKTEIELSILLLNSLKTDNLFIEVYVDFSIDKENGLICTPTKKTIEDDNRFLLSSLVAKILQEELQWAWEAKILSVRHSKQFWLDKIDLTIKQNNKVLINALHLLQILQTTIKEKIKNDS